MCVACGTVCIDLYGGRDDLGYCGNMWKVVRNRVWLGWRGGGGGHEISVRLKIVFFFTELCYW